MSTVTIEYYGVTGSGRNVTEAKRNAGSQLEKFVRNCHPRIFSRNGHTAVVYRIPGGAFYSLAYPDSDGAIYSSSSCGESDAEESAVRHLLTVSRKLGDYTVPKWAQLIVDGRRLVEDWKRSDAFCKAYRHAETLPAEELPRGGAHQWACDHEREFAQ